MAVLCVSVVTACMLLSVLFASGVRTDCREAKLFVTAPKKIQALSGSCLQIPCIFRVDDSKTQFNSSGKIIGMWIKDNDAFYFHPENVVFNSGSKVPNKYPLTITGNLNDKNCTTLFSNLITKYTNTYYFRIENKPFLETAFCDPFQITVIDSPWRPTVEISGDLKEKKTVTVTCSALTPCPHSPPKLTWNLQQDSHNRMEENEDGTFTTKIQTTITLSDQHDGNNIICSAAYPVNEGVKTAEETKTLSVSYVPKDTTASLSPSGLVSAGSWVNLSCTSRANPPVSRFIWFKNNQDGAKSVSEGQIYSFNVTEEGDYYCVAINNLGNHTSSVIYLSGGAAQQLSSPPWGAVSGGMFVVIVLLCVVVGIRWLKLKRQSSRQRQRPTVEEPVFQEQAREADVEEIHYGEIDFSKRRPEPPSVSAQHGAQQQEMLYAQVKVSSPAKHSTQTTADCHEPIYAKVKR